MICQRFNVTDIPTILYGDPLDPLVYTENYDYASLSSFAKNELSQPVCHVRHLDACDDATKALIAQLRTKSKEELLLETSEMDAKMEAAWASTFSMLDYNANVTRMERESNFKWVQQILAEDHDVDMEESRFMWVEDATDDDDGFDEEEEEEEIGGYEGDEEEEDYDDYGDDAVTDDYMNEEDGEYDDGEDDYDGDEL